MRPTRRIAGLALLAGCAVGAGCGSGGGTIARTDADGLQSGLDNVAQAVSEGRCGAAGAAVDNVRSKVTNLQGQIPARLQQNLEKGVRRLAAATPGDCRQIAEGLRTQSTTTTTTTTAPTTTEETTTSTTETTTPTTDTTTPTTDTTATTEPDTGGVAPGQTTDTTTTDPGTGGATGGGVQP
jgi:hypothetical protein